MKKKVCAALIVFGTAGPLAYAVPVTDQSSAPSISRNLLQAGESLSQGVTAGLSGTLTGAMLSIGTADANITGQYTFSVLDATGFALYSATQSLPALAQAQPNVLFDVSAANLFMNAGDKFFLQISNPTGFIDQPTADPRFGFCVPICWLRNALGDYSGGELIMGDPLTGTWPGGDGGFATFVEVSPSPVPLPAAAWLLLSGLGGMQAILRRTRRGSVTGSSGLNASRRARQEPR